MALSLSLSLSLIPLISYTSLFINSIYATIGGQPLLDICLEEQTMRSKTTGEPISRRKANPLRSKMWKKHKL